MCCSAELKNASETFVGISKFKETRLQARIKMRFLSFNVIIVDNIFAPGKFIILIFNSIAEDVSPPPPRKIDAEQKPILILNGSVLSKQ